MSNPRLSIIPAGAVTDRSLEPRDLQVLCLLGRHTDKAGWCVRSQVRMAGEIACSRASLQNSLDRLCEANWIEKKRRDTEVEEAGKHPSRSYAYRVLLDRDDFALESVARDTPEDDSESYAETASEEGGCQPVGTPPVPTEQHGGANACVGTRANTYVGTKNDPLERPPSERERDARARDRKEKFKAAFRAKWPDVVTDSQQRLNYALDGLTPEEEPAALAGIEPFMAAMKRKNRGTVPAASTYVEEKRWTLLEQPDGGLISPAAVRHAPDSAEAKALAILHDIVGRFESFRRIWRAQDGSVNFSKPFTPQLVALAQAPPRDQWVSLTHQQAGAWEGLFRQFFDANIVRQRMREGSIAPWHWPPKMSGELYTSATGPPETFLTEQDLEEDFK